MPKSPTKLSSTPVQIYNNAPQVQPEPLQLYEASILDGGMVSQFDPADIDPKQLSLAVNCYIRNTITARRAGDTLITPAKPDSNVVLAFFDYKDPLGIVFLYRISTGSIFLKGSVWTSVTGAALASTPNSQIQVVTAGTFVGFGNGIDPFQQIDVAGNTYARAGNAPAYKYWCTIANRLIGFNLSDPSTPVPIQLGWSGILNFTEFDPDTDPSAGSEPLETSPSNFSDFGTGIFAFGDNLLAVRERSLWIGTVQASATDPFYFYNSVPTMGCDTPKSIQQIPSGIVYYDRRLKNVFTYTLGDPAPKPIGDVVRDAMRDMVTDPNLVFSSYDYSNDEYMLAIPIGSSNVVRIWSFNFKSQAWEYDTANNLSMISSINYNAGSQKISDLLGSINSLVGNIGDLSPNTEQASIFYGYETGEITIEDLTSDLDNGQPSEMDLRSKLFQMDTANNNVSQFHITYNPNRAGSFTIWYSKDDGQTFTEYKTVSFLNTDFAKRLTVVCNKHVRSKTFMWRITQDTGSCDFIEYKIWNFAVGGYQRQRIT